MTALAREPRDFANSEDRWQHAVSASVWVSFVLFVFLCFFFHLLSLPLSPSTNLSSSTYIANKADAYPQSVPLSMGACLSLPP